MLMRLLIPSAIALAAASQVVPLSPAATRWSIDAKPTVDIGDEKSDTLDTFGEIAGVARISTGEILVADRKSLSLRYFGPDGRYRRSAGRKGDGPGEFNSMLRLLHCGDSLFVQDWHAPLWSVLGEQGGFKRKSPIASPKVGRPHYRTQCNNAGIFIGYGWEETAQSKVGYFRPTVPVWLANPDGKVRVEIGARPGVDRWGFERDKHLSGTGPLPLGRSPAIAIGKSRAYFGTADSFAIEVYNLDGKSLGVIRKPGVKLQVTKTDIERAIALDTTGNTAESKKSTMERIYNVVTLPKTVPAYAEMLVDRDDFLWVQLYPRGGDAMAHWIVFSPTGVETAEIDLPLNLKVAEIGRDFVLGVRPELRDGTDHVVMYRLKRGG